MPAELSLGSRIVVRVERDDDAHLTRGLFACPCGWTTTTSGHHLVVPESVRSHNRVCPCAMAEQLTFDQLLEGAA